MGVSTVFFSHFVAMKIIQSSPQAAQRNLETEASAMNHSLIHCKSIGHFSSHSTPFCCYVLPSLSYSHELRLVWLCYE